MDLLMTTETIGAFPIGQARERVSPMFLFFIVEFIKLADFLLKHSSSSLDATPGYRIL
jgi:hypothetical protein